MKRVRGWLAYHSIAHHLVAPIWVRLPEGTRWRIAHWLDRSQRREWCQLVDAIYTVREDDACDIRIPLGTKRGRCANTCFYFGHTGEHACDCYCGKFKFKALDGYNDRSLSEV